MSQRCLSKPPPGRQRRAHGRARPSMLERSKPARDSCQVHWCGFHMSARQVILLFQSEFGMLTQATCENPVNCWTHTYTAMTEGFPFGALADLGSGHHLLLHFNYRSNAAHASPAVSLTPLPCVPGHPCSGSAATSSRHPQHHT